MTGVSHRQLKLIIPECQRFWVRPSRCLSFPLGIKTCHPSFFTRKPPTSVEMTCPSCQKVGTIYTDYFFVWKGGACSARQPRLASFALARPEHKFLPRHVCQTASPMASPVETPEPQGYMASPGVPWHQLRCWYRKGTFDLI